MKVYGINLDGKFRGIVCAKNKTIAASLFNVSMYHFRNYACETGNKEEIDIAQKEPTVVFKQEFKHGAPWIRVNPK